MPNEREQLKEHGVEQNLIEVNLVENPHQLQEIMRDIF